MVGCGFWLFVWGVVGVVLWWLVLIVVMVEAFGLVDSS